MPRLLALPAGLLVSDDGWQRARRVLCVRLDTIGDVVMTGPAIRALAESGSRPAITLLTSPAGARVAALMPDVDEVISWEAPWMKARAPVRRGCDLHRLQPEPAARRPALPHGRRPTLARALPREPLPAAHRPRARARARRAGAPRGAPPARPRGERRRPHRRRAAEGPRPGRGTRGPGLAARRARHRRRAALGGRAPGRLGAVAPLPGGPLGRGVPPARRARAARLQRRRR